MRALVAATAALALIAAAGCKSSQPGSVELTIVADPSLSDATVAAIGALEISVSGAATVSQSYLVSSSFASGRQERIVLRPPVSSGTLTIAVMARSAAGAALGYGQTDVALKSSGSVSATVTLTGNVPPSDGGAPSDMSTGGGPSLNLIAGHIGGMGFADGMGTAARFNHPRGAVIIGGNLYVADMNNSVIRQIVLATGAVTTIAGSPLVRGSADGTGSAAHFDHPTSLATDGTNLYVTDMRNDTIRKVALPSAAVTTLAGSPGQGGSTDATGAAARFDHPHGIVGDGAGNLYVADAHNHIIRKIVISSGVVTTLAGTAGSAAFMDGTGAAARFNAPHSLAFDNGNIYVADMANHAIRMVVASSGVVTTPFGTGTNGGFVDATGAAARFNAPRGVVADGAGNLWVADTNNQRIRKIVIASGAVTTLAGNGNFGSSDGTGGGAGFANPFSLAADGSGNLYVTEAFGHTVRKVAPSGVTTTVAGLTGADGLVDGSGAAALFERPHALCSDGTNLYVTDKMSHSVRKVVVATGAVTTLAGANASGSSDGVGAMARFNQPFGCAADGAGTLYVSDSNNATIRAIDLASATVTTLAGSAGKNGSTDATGSAARFNNPAALAFGSGTLYVADMANSTIRAVALPSGAVTTLAGTAGMTGSTDATGTAARFHHPNGLVLDSGNLYVADQANHTIRRIVISSGAVTTVAGTAGMRGTADGTGAAARFFAPHALATDGKGNLFVADTLNHTVRQIVIASGAVSTIAGVAGLASVKLGALPGVLNTPSGVVFVGGALCVTTTHENAILAIQ
jgi:sugar lactone lactonase YvrE